VIELGFPYSDPIADGPTIQAAFTRALSRGLHVHDVFEMVRRVRGEGVDVPILAMLSYSLVYRIGPKRFVAAAVEAGLDGATVPDLPVDEASALEEAARAQDFHVIYLVSPTTDADRLAHIIERARGFIYCISVRGITGVRQGVSGDLEAYVSRIRSDATVPVAVGFGIGTAEQASVVGRYSDGVIVGSAIVRLIAEKSSAGTDAVVESVGAFVRELSTACRDAT
jgi:tryptophan synthase alpha chain